MDSIAQNHSTEEREGPIVRLPLELHVQIARKIKLKHRVMLHYVSRYFRQVLSLSLVNLDLSKFDMDFIVEKILPILQQSDTPFLRTVSLAGQNMIGYTAQLEDELHLIKADSLTSLNLSRTHISGSVTYALSRLTNLTSLNLRYTKIGDTTLMHISNLTKLETLLIRSAYIDERREDVLTDQGMLCLTSLTNLRVLEYSQGRSELGRVVGSQLSCIVPLTNLVRLSLPNNDLTIHSFTSLAGKVPQSIEVLNLSWCIWLDINAFVDLLSEFKSLRTLHFVGAEPKMILQFPHYTVKQKYPTLVVNFTDPVI